MNDAWCLGFDIGGTRLKAAAISPAHEVLATDTMRVDGTDIQGILALMHRLADDYESRLAARPMAIGVAVPGLVRASEGAAVLPGRGAGLAGFPLVATLTERTGVPTVCLNDGTAAVIGEWRVGAGRGHTDVVCITLGTGVGGGAIVHGTPVGDLERGLGSYLGHLSLEGDGEACVCGNQGCAETLLSANALVGRVRAAIARAVPTTLAELARSRDGVLTFEDIVAGAETGDALCVMTIDRFVRDLSRFLVSIAHVLAPEVIVISGGAAPACAGLLDGVRAHVATRVFALDGMAPRVVISALGDLAGVHGACAEAWRRVGR